MTTLTMRCIKGDFVITGPDVEPNRVKGQGLVSLASSTLASHRDWKGRIKAAGGGYRPAG